MPSNHKLSSASTVTSGENSPQGVASISAPINEQQLSLLQQGSAGLSGQQLSWLSGYFWGLAQSGSIAQGVSSQQAELAVATQPAGKLTIIFASQTGNAKGVAQSIEQQARERGISVELYDASDYKPKNLAKESHVIIVASTNGEGEAPDNALGLHEFLQSKKAPKLNQLQYAVIGLGDSSYEFFCQTGKDFDTFLAKLGAQAFQERIDCDVDYESDASAWSEKALQTVESMLASETSAEVVSLPLSQSIKSTFTKQNPFNATLLTSQKITGRDSSKSVHHIEIDLEGSSIQYQPGDALGVWFENSPTLVQAIVERVGLAGSEQVEVDGQSMALTDALIQHYEVTSSNPQLVTQFASLSESKKLLKLSEDKEKLRLYAADTQVIDVLAEKKSTLSAQQLLSILRRLTPRLYSIASSQTEVEEEVHLTVGLVEYQHGDEKRFGGASHFLSQQLEEGSELKVYVESNDHFKLPENDEVAVIMIGPGTGIAPFRSFIQERDNRGATGKNWLFFGDRTFTQDFLYQVEWQKYLKSGLLTRLDVAFSRDQNEKYYVQHRILEQAQQVWQWLEEGAHIYICGDANRMAKDVHQALVSVVETQGQYSPEEAEAFLNELRKAKRYQKDVY